MIPIALHCQAVTASALLAAETRKKTYDEVPYLRRLIPFSKLHGDIIPSACILIICRTSIDPVLSAPTLMEKRG